MAAETEQEFARKISAWLDGFTVYQEVSYLGRVADFVVDVNGRGWVIECKKSLGLAVLEQADHWIRMGIRQVSIAVPHARNGTQRRFAVKVASWVGCGVLTVHAARVHEDLAPRINRCPPRRRRGKQYRDILDACCEEHKTYCEAGSANGGHYTPFKRTCDRILNAVRRKPGMSIKELVESVDHHYASSASARQSIPRWIEADKIGGVRLERDGKFLRVYPVESTFCEKRYIG